MVLDPRSSDEIYSDLKSKLTDSIATLTNFISSSFNDDWLSGYADQLHTAEVKATASELAGYIDWAGATLSEEDLTKLGISGVDPDEINAFMDDDQLDQIGELMGIDRDSGSKATGTVTFELSSSSVEIDEGFEVGTEPDTNGDYESFYVDANENGEIDQNSTATTSPSSGTTLQVDVIAAGVGDQYNVGSGSITFIPSPKPGIESITQNSEMTGGEDEQDNDDYRSDIKDALFTSSGGGTARGIEGYVENNASSDDVEASVKEYPSRSPPEVDVVVDYPNSVSKSEMDDLIEESHPVGVKHNLVEPTLIQLGADVEVLGTDIDTSFVDSQIDGFLTEIDVGERFSQSQLVGTIIRSDADIDSVNALSVSVSTVTDEIHTYQSGTDTYELDFEPIGQVQEEQHHYEPGQSTYRLAYHAVDASSVTVEAIVDGDTQVLTRGGSNDYTIVDDDGDGSDDAIEFQGNTTPDDHTAFRVDYEHASGSVTDITDESGDTYSKGTDFDVIDGDGDGLDDAIDWSINTTTPDDMEDFYVEYEPGRSVLGDLFASDYEKIGADVNRVGVTQFDE